jgi:hypothetical protein
MEAVPAYVLATLWKSVYGYLSSDWIHALVLGIFAVSRLRAVRYLLVIGGALALSGCLSLRLGSNDRPQPTAGRLQPTAGKGAGAVDVANSIAEAPGRS